jgi:hypothetical protein
MHLVETPHSTLTTRELQRLAVYKAAVAAGFYSDWDGSATALDTELLSWLLRPGAVGRTEYPFTPDERQRLERVRVAVAGGFYSEDLRG